MVSQKFKTIKFTKFIDKSKKSINNQKNNPGKIIYNFQKIMSRVT